MLCAILYGVIVQGWKYCCVELTTPEYAGILTIMPIVQSYMDLQAASREWQLRHYPQIQEAYCQ